MVRNERSPAGMTLQSLPLPPPPVTRSILGVGEIQSPPSPSPGVNEQETQSNSRIYETNRKRACVFLGSAVLQFPIWGEFWGFVYIYFNVEYMVFH